MYKTLSVLAALSLFQGLTQKGCSGDTDYDGVADNEDNCVEAYNPEQGDEDGDSIGDACDRQTANHGLSFDGCFSSDWPPLRGINWEDRPTLIEQGDVDPTQLYVSIDWTSSDSDWIESGEGTTNGLGIWFEIYDEHNPYHFTKTFTEGEGMDTNGDGMVDEITGTYLMLVCESELGHCGMEDDYAYFTDGVWTAQRINSLECNNL